MAGRQISIKSSKSCRVKFHRSPIISFDAADVEQSVKSLSSSIRCPHPMAAQRPTFQTTRLLSLLLMASHASAARLRAPKQVASCLDLDLDLPRRPSRLLLPARRKCTIPARLPDSPPRGREAFGLCNCCAAWMILRPQSAVRLLRNGLPQGGRSQGVMTQHSFVSKRRQQPGVWERREAKGKQELLLPHRAVRVLMLPPRFPPHPAPTAACAQRASHARRRMKRRRPICSGR